MATFEIKMPKLGESITEGTIISWSVKTGDFIKEDDVLSVRKYLPPLPEKYLKYYSRKATRLQ